MDNTLSLLYNSAISKGLPHRLTRNLSFLLLKHNIWWSQRIFASNKHWNPSLPPDSPAYRPPTPAEQSKQQKKEEKLRPWKELDESAWGALGQVVRLAEGRHDISLGTIVSRRMSRGRR